MDGNEKALPKRVEKKECRGEFPATSSGFVRFCFNGQLLPLLPLAHAHCAAG